MFVVIDMLPKYLSDVQDFQLINDGFVSGIPFLATLISGCTAYLFVGDFKRTARTLKIFFKDFIQHKNIMSSTNIRRILTIIAFTPPTILVCFIPALGCNSAAIVVVICDGLNHFLLLIFKSRFIHTESFFFDIFSLK